MSRREDIVSCIDVTIMDRCAHRALPSPDSKIFPAFGAGAAVTHAAGLGGKRFRDLGMNRSNSVSMAGALCAGQERFQIAVKAIGIDRWSLITERGKRAQPQIDSHTRHRTIEDRTDGGFISLLRSIANCSDLEGYPAERAAGTTTLTPGEPNFSMLSAPPRVFFRDLLHRLDGQMQGAVADLARQAAKPRRVHPYSIPKLLQNTGKTVLNTQKRLLLSLAGLNVVVSREELG
jgi:hypothetical protein